MGRSIDNVSHDGYSQSQITKQRAHKTERKNRKKIDIDDTCNSTNYYYLNRNADNHYHYNRDKFVGNKGHLNFIPSYNSTQFENCEYYGNDKWTKQDGTPIERISNEINKINDNIAKEECTQSETADDLRELKASIKQLKRRGKLSTFTGHRNKKYVDNKYGCT